MAENKDNLDTSANTLVTTKKKSHKGLIASLICLAIIMYIIPLVIIFVGVFAELTSTYKFTEENNRIIIGKNKLTITEVSGAYDQEREEFTITGLIDSVPHDYSLELTFDVYNADHYIIGQAYGMLELQENESYVVKATYFDNDAKDVVSFKLHSVGLY